MSEPEDLSPERLEEFASEVSRLLEDAAERVFGRHK